MERPRLASLAVELTLACNQACPHCYNPPPSRAEAPAPARLLARLARLAEALDIRRVTLTGGEPFMYQGLPEVLGFAHARGWPTLLISNGRLITAERAARLRAREVLGVQLTLHGVDDASHDAQVGDGGFQETLAGAAALRAAHVPLFGCVVITRKNAPQVGALVELWRSLGASAVALSRFSPAGQSVTASQELLPRVADLEVAFAGAAAVARRSSLTVRATMPVPPCAFDAAAFAPIRFGTCAIGTPSQEFALGIDGALRHCTLHRRPLGGGQDVLSPELDLVSLLRSPEVTEYRARVPSFCRGCAHAATCSGGCGAAAEWVTGEPGAYPDPLLLQYLTRAEARLPCDPASS